MDVSAQRREFRYCRLCYHPQSERTRVLKTIIDFDSSIPRIVNKSLHLISPVSECKPRMEY